jgi:hypothetical protein
MNIKKTLVTTSVMELEIILPVKDFHNRCVSKLSVVKIIKNDRYAMPDILYFDITYYLILDMN